MIFDIRKARGVTAAALCLAAPGLHTATAAADTLLAPAGAAAQWASAGASRPATSGPGTWRLVVRLWESPAVSGDRIHTQWVVNTYGAGVDCQRALQGRVSGIHPVVRARSVMVCVHG
jgi:hypothetical protein